MSRNRSSRLFIPVALGIHCLPSSRHVRIHRSNDSDELASGTGFRRATPRLEMAVYRRFLDAGKPDEDVSEQSVQRAQHPGIRLFDVVVPDQADAD